MQKLQTFIEENSLFIYDYINKEVLENIAIINYEYFLKTIEEIFTKKALKKINVNNINLLPYFILTKLEDKIKLDYTSLRAETINLNQLNKEASTYYNYVEFSLNKDYFIIKLMQSKIGGMPIDEDIIKFKKEILLNKTGLEEFIKK